MQTKICSKCKIEKDISEFHKCSKTKNGFRSKCKLCINKESRDYSKNNRDIRNKIQKEWRVKNQEKIKNYRKKYYDENPDNFIKISAEYRKKNPEKVKKQLKEYYLKNLEYHKNRQKLWADKNKEHKKNKKKLWNKNNREHINKYNQEKNQNDIIFNLIRKCRSRLQQFLKTKNMSKKNKTFEIIGCSPQELKEHLEKQFVEGMTWNNRNEWHIDHIIPLSSGKNEEEIHKLCYYTNLQPLWVSDNLKKSNKLIKN
jgi:hypothetical protein